MRITDTNATNCWELLLPQLEIHVLEFLPQSLRVAADPKRSGDGDLFAIAAARSQVSDVAIALTNAAVWRWWLIINGIFCRLIRCGANGRFVLQQLWSPDDSG